MNEIEALTILAATPGLGPVKNKLLINYFGSALKTLNASLKDISQLPALSVETKTKWKWWEHDPIWKKNLECAENQDIKIIPFTSADFPTKLLALHDHPLLLYVKGSLNNCDKQSLGVVGTRDASIYGLEMAEKISSDLARNRFTVVSGLARGIDTAAHKGALATGRTIAVIGSGLGAIYPTENTQLADRIAENGAVISEFSMYTPPNKQNFPRRNRIVSGMTLGALLIEAPIKSGAMITMEKSLEYKRKLYAIPGRADLENFKGNHYLIKSGVATLVENAQDIVESSGRLFDTNQLIPELQSVYANLDKEEKEFLEMLPSEELNIEEIIKRTKLPIIKLNILLMSLMMKKALKEYPGKIYKKGLG